VQASLLFLRIRQYCQHLSSKELSKVLKMASWACACSSPRTDISSPAASFSRSWMDKTSLSWLRWSIFTVINVPIQRACRWQSCLEWWQHRESSTGEWATGQNCTMASLNLPDTQRLKLHMSLNVSGGDSSFKPQLGGGGGGCSQQTV